MLDKIIKRDGNVVPFAAEKITNAILQAMLKDADGQLRNSAGVLSQGERELAATLTIDIVKHLEASCERSGLTAVNIETVQDTVELYMMRSALHDVARDYVIYRNRHRAEREVGHDNGGAIKMRMINTDGTEGIVSTAYLRIRIKDACKGLDNVNPDAIFDVMYQQLYNGVTEAEIDKAVLMAARGFIETEPQYNQVTARLLADDIHKEVFFHLNKPERDQVLRASIELGVKLEMLQPAMATYDLDRLQAALKWERDAQFSFIGLQTLYDRYFLHQEEVRYESSQIFWMRVAMGLALNESDREARAIEFYDLLSQFEYMNSTPTLFNSGTTRPQLASCFLTTISDDLDGIYDGIHDNARLQKWAGGLGNDWTPVRSLGARIKGTNGKSQGVVPFLKVVNDTAVAVNQGGKRKGAVCAYLETWHLDIEEFLDLRKNTGDERRRTHDMNTANWIPDLFMKRVMEKGEWTLFSPSDVTDLHDLFGRAFETAYTNAERKTQTGEIKLFKTVKAVDLWRKMLSMLFETGHPWITFKDPCNIRSPQQHMGVVHSSNLCTEITLNTSADEIAVCNIGSVNLVAHMIKIGNDAITGAPVYDIDESKLAKTVKTAMRILDNVIDLNFYSVEKAKNSNMRHRPVGLGMMGFQDCLQMMHVPYASEDAVLFADKSTEMIAYHAYSSSCDMAIERGRYFTFEGSLWSKGILPQDSQRLLAEERGAEYLTINTDSFYGESVWDELRQRIKYHGMRNSNCLAIAPTATISNIIDVSACIEPTFQNLFVKSNLSGEFTIINRYLVADLKELGLWDEVMISDIKFYDGSIQKISRIPQSIKDVYATAFEIAPEWLIEAAARRQKWIDQAQSLNIYMAGASGKKLDATYKLAWQRGLKTTYYLRTTSATSAEKSTGRGGELNAVQSNVPVAAAPVAVPGAGEADAGAACYMRPGDPGFEECEACQ
jgi:ribonucleoside-diphosphate reductase alpha chain